MGFKTYIGQSRSHLIPDAVALVNTWKDVSDRNFCEYYLVFNHGVKEHVYRSYSVDGDAHDCKESLGGKLSFDDDVHESIHIDIMAILTSYADEMSNNCDKAYFYKKIDNIRLKETSRVNAALLLRSADLEYVLDTIKGKARTETAVFKEIREIIGVVKNYQNGYHLEL